MPPRAKKREQEDLHNEAGEDEDYAEDKPKAKKARKPKEEVKISTELQDLWSVKEPSLLYRHKAHNADGVAYTFAPGEKIAAFDFDDTLVAKKSSARFAINADDWKPFNKNVYKVVKDLHAKGFKIVVFSNQKGVGKTLAGKQSRNVRQRAENFIAGMGLADVTVLMATQEDDYRKPNTGMWRFFVDELNAGAAPDLSASFFVGDAAGRKLDFSDSDKVFAEKVGIAFKTPEELFGEGAKKDLTGPGRAPVTDGPNQAMASVFLELAAALEARGDVWPSRAAKKSAEAIANFPDAIKQGKDLAHIKGVGKGTVKKIDEYLSTGTLADLSGAAGAEGGGGGGAGGAAAAAGGAGAGKAADAERAMAANFLD